MTEHTTVSSNRVEPMPWAEYRKRWRSLAAQLIPMCERGLAERRYSARAQKILVLRTVTTRCVVMPPDDTEMVYRPAIGARTTQVAGLGCDLPASSFVEDATAMLACVPEANCKPSGSVMVASAPLCASAIRATSENSLP